MENLIKRFVKYAKVHTTSNEDSETVPSTEIQKNLGKILVEDLKEIGLSDAYMDDKGYVYATLKSNTDKKLKKIGFIAHMDTSPAASGENVNPQIHRNYDGGDIIVNKEKNIVLSPSEFSILSQKVGKTIITSDGTTLLGADDKAGITEIIEALKYIIENPQIEHSDIKVCFTPDEEVGRGADFFDVEGFNTDFAYTVDGGEIGELEYENFNASSVDIKIIGKSVHPGSAYNVMINAAAVATEFNSMVPQNEVPEKTKGYEGFYMLTSISGEVDEAKLSYILRDFDLDGLNQRKAKIEEIAKILQQKYGEDRIIVEIKDSYYNMKEKIEPVMYIIDLAKKAMKDADIEPKIVPIRGGTDGARISYMGIPTPNLFTGGYNFHGYYEYAVAEEMEKAKEVIINIVKNNK
ncbi:peptidase T [Intestinibacter bartlettii CAG:1329]|uniref:Peptidase T n=2 Tax=Intestinibacter bartlettii TaxID=261299 RepID=R5XH52_9FIRM|nr:peptidase T [Intestinibacter bartlettii]CDA11714.1 peptidase T [Intestinibacter bartlettii CAG:1329]